MKLGDKSPNGLIYLMTFDDILWHLITFFEYMNYDKIHFSQIV